MGRKKEDALEQTSEDITSTTNISKDTLIDSLAKEVNNKFKNEGYKVAYFLQDGDSPSEVKEFVSTGSTLLDLAISNRPNGGFPVGRITEITGLEASGKSLLAAYALASTQKQGGTAIFIDTESAVSTEFLQVLGVDLTKLIYCPLETIEDIFSVIESMIGSIRKNEDKRLITIVVDSIAGASTKTETATSYDKDGYATAKAIILSKSMRKITNLISRERICLILTNQLRQKLNAMPFGDQYTTSGGKAIAFHSSVRIRLSSVGKIKGKINNLDSIIGISTRAQVIKNRIGPPNRDIRYDIFYTSGIDDSSSVFAMLVDIGIFKQGGNRYTYMDIDTGEEIKIAKKEFDEKFWNIPEMKDKLYKQLCDAYILKYDTQKIKDIEVVQNLPEEE
jgi:recombination protein RecA